MIVTIGNCPSSGSTFLADLLDSVDFVVCGPELHLFSSRRHFADCKRVGAHPHRGESTPCLAAPYSVKLARNVLPAYGMTPKALADLRNSAPSFVVLCEQFFERYARFRGKGARLFVEKTPENIHTAKQFLHSFADGVFLHIVRDPRHVYRSLRRRGMPPIVALGAWLVDVAAAYEMREHERVYTIRYEDLVADPPSAVAGFLEFVGERASSEGLIDRYRANTYRGAIPRVSAWSKREYGESGSANDDRFCDEERSAFALFPRLKVGRSYARLFDVPEVSYADLMVHYGYHPEREETSFPRRLRLDGASARWLSTKWLKDTLIGAAAWPDLPTYLSPIEIA